MSHGRRPLKAAQIDRPDPRRHPVTFDFVQAIGNAIGVLNNTPKS